MLISLHEIYAIRNRTKDEHSYLKVSHFGDRPQNEYFRKVSNLSL